MKSIQAIVTNILANEKDNSFITQQNYVNDISSMFSDEFNEEPYNIKKEKFEHYLKNNSFSFSEFLRKFCEAAKKDLTAADQIMVSKTLNTFLIVYLFLSKQEENKSSWLSTELNKIKWQIDSDKKLQQTNGELEVLYEALQEYNSKKSLSGFRRIQQQLLAVANDKERLEQFHRTILEFCTIELSIYVVPVEVKGQIFTI